MENATAHYHHLPLLARMRSTGPFTLSIGFGIGSSAEESKLHAERALTGRFSAAAIRPILWDPAFPFLSRRHRATG